MHAVHLRVHLREKVVSVLEPREAKPREPGRLLTSLDRRQAPHLALESALALCSEDHLANPRRSDVHVIGYVLMALPAVESRKDLSTHPPLPWLGRSVPGAEADLRGWAA